MSNDYKVDSIKVLSDIEHIRTRPGMYIGELDVPPLALFNEAIDNAFDEAQNDPKSETIVRITEENGLFKYSIRDHGRGIPIGEIDLPDGRKMEALEALITTTNSGAKFNSNIYKISAGLHGVGMACICALSKYMHVITYRDYEAVEFISENGIKKALNHYPEINEVNGVLTEFIADPELWNTTEIPIDSIIDRCKVANAMGYKIKLYYNNEEIKIDTKSILDLLPIENVSDYCSDTIRIDNKETGEYFLVGFKYTSDTKSKSYGYTDLLPNRYGGTHIKIITDNLCRAWREFYDDDSVWWNDSLLGVRLVVAAFISNVSFSSQTKEKLTVPYKQLNFFGEEFLKEFKKWIKENRNLADKLFARFKEYRQSLIKLQNQKDIAGKVKIATIDKEGRTRRSQIVDKLMDCTSNKVEDTEIFLCLSGDTQIKMLDGTEPTLEELVERYPDPNEEFWVYSCDDTGNFIPVKAHNPRITRYTDKLLEIELSDGTKLKCTPNHKFMNKETMDWIRADEMKIGTSLHHLTFGKTIDGRSTVYSNYFGRYKEIPTYRIIGHMFYDDEFNKIKKNYDITKNRMDRPQFHHIDCDKHNDTPENLECISQQIHWCTNKHSKLNKERIINYNKSENHKIDMKQAWENKETRIKMSQGYPHSQEFKDRMREFALDENSKVCSKNWNETYNNTNKHYEDLSKRLSKFPELKKKHIEKLNKMNSDPTIKRNQMRGKIGKMINKLISENLEFNEENWKFIMNHYFKHGGIRYENILKYFDSYKEAYEFGKNWNYKVVSIKEVIYNNPVPVYCMTVDSNHRFALINGIISKNCEGDSAAGVIARPRDRKTQAVLPLRGKIQNVSGMSYKDALKHETVANIINSLGAGIGESADPKKCRYERIIISTDADDDGCHIVALVLTALVNLVPPLVRAGMVYLLDPPLYKYYDKDGKPIYTSDFDSVPENAKGFIRFKGLGAMEDEDFKNTCLNKNNRTLYQVTYPDDIDQFNHIAGTSAGRSELLKRYGVIKDVSAELEESEEE